MSLTVSSIFANIIFGIIGYYLFRSGKRNGNHKHLVIGLVMMLYTFFTNGALAEWGIGLALCAAAYFWRE